MSGIAAEPETGDHRVGENHHDHNGDHLEHDHHHFAAEYVRLGLMALVIAASLTGWWKHLISRDWLAFFATLIGGYPIFYEAWENLRKRRMTMELSMTIALVAALCIGQFFTALVIAFFVLFAELLEGYTVGGGCRAIEKLIESLPRQVTVRRDGWERELSTQEVGRGETIIIRPGSRIPADGEVRKGHSFVDQSSITGESLPVEKVEGSKVFAGTINKDGVLEVRVEKIGRDTTFGKIIEIVEQAEKSKAPVERVSDRLAAGLVYFALGAAVLTLIVTRNLTSTIAVIIVAGACGVAAGTPLAILAGIGNAARRGIIIKGGLYLEQLSQIDTVVLDKTGTLTLGVPEVTSITTLNGASEEEVLQTAAIAEQHSEHPLGEAIVRRARERNLPLREYANLRYLPGKGLTCDDNGNEILVGSRALFEERGVSVPAEFVADFAGAKSAGRTTVLVGGNKVAMVGDGVNDAPALAEATVGIAMGQGTDVALETADVTLMTSDLSRLLEVLAISKRCYGVIMFNFWGTILVDTAGIALAFFGLLAPIIAALIHVGSELGFILNSARLFRQAPPVPT